MCATFDAVYSVSTMNSHTVRQETDPSISNVDVVAKVIKGALNLGRPHRA